MGDLVNVAPGQCRVAVDSASQLSLNRHKGMFLPLKISGVWEAKIIPATPPTISNSGLTAGDLLYLYAFDDAGDLTLEFDDTGHSPDADTGVEIKTGDASRTLLAMVKLDAGTPGTFVDAPTTKRWLLNWFNRRRLDVQGTLSANRNMTGFSFTEPNTEIRTNFLTWPDEAVSAGIAGSVRRNNAGITGYLFGVAFDGTTPEACCGGQVDDGTTGTDINHGVIAVHVWKALTEGAHYATMVGAFEDNGLSAFTVFTADTASSARAKAWVRVGVMG